MTNFFFSTDKNAFWTSYFFLEMMLESWGCGLYPSLYGIIMLILSAKKTVRININNIEHKSFVKSYIDEHLNWESQIQHVKNKIAKNVGILYKIRKYVDLNVPKQLYYTLVYPYLLKIMVP